MTTPSSSEFVGAQLWRRLAAEFLGTATLLAVVVGAGIAAQRLSPADSGLQLQHTAIATALGLGVLILVFQTVSGAHFNPVVTLIEHFLDRHRTRVEVLAYWLAQVSGAITGTVLANLMFGVTTTVSGTDRATVETFIAEIVATSGLIVVIFALARTGRASKIGLAVGAYIGAAYWFTSSTSFANPAVTIARMFSDTFTGIAPSSVLPFLGAQLIGATVGGVIVHLVFTDQSRRTASVRG